MARLLRIDANLPWQCRQAKGGNWVAACDPLMLTLQAETWAELMEDIALTLDAMFRDLLSTNELERFLRDHGWSVSGTIPNRQEEVRFDVPFFPAIVREYGSPRQLYQ